MPGVFDNERFRKLLLSLPGRAIEILYQQYYRSLVGLAFSFTKDPIASEDIVQETFVHVWENSKKLGKFHERSFEHYLVRVVKFKSITHFKKNLKEHQNNQELLRHKPVVNELSAEAALIRKEFITEIRQLVATFPPRERECLVLKMDEELTTQQIADRMGVSVKAVERTVTSAYKRLREYWEPPAKGFSSKSSDLP
jgi:RNA polymerase sigma factor (sigma-70 family)